MKGALEWHKGLPLLTREQVTKAWASLVYTLLWLPGRLLHVYLGTYTSHNVDVRRAGLVADINALALAVAVILLLTSRSTISRLKRLSTSKALQTCCRTALWQGAPPATSGLLMAQ